MKLNIDCYPCILRLALSLAKLTGLTNEQQKNVINTTMNILKETSEHTFPQHIFVNINEYIKDNYFKDTISFDPYKKLKYESNKTALKEAEIVSSGCKFPGLILDHTSDLLILFMEVHMNKVTVLSALLVAVVINDHTYFLSISNYH